MRLDMVAILEGIGEGMLIAYLRNVFLQISAITSKSEILEHVSGKREVPGSIYSCLLLISEA